ncbi:MAG: carboxypeptidase-like regulatory domain-containing protein [Bacteroidales bacterium]|jgi:TonB-dependent SusC/RagA subfamily outer membrane receptor|nr:carboxypeptidase-like regulatory domain-containing protein [Bacteroidales bacterium]
MNLFHYIQGKRKGKAAHRIEREAMQDPFLAEALEGYDVVPGEHSTAIERMQQQVMHSGPSKSRSILLWTSMAASILLISGIGWYLLRSDSSDIPTLSILDSIPQSESPAPAKSILQLESESHPDVQLKKSVPPSASSPVLNIVEDMSVTDDQLALEEEIVVAEVSDSFDKEKSELSDEVVVVASGKQKKENVIDAVTSINPEDMKAPSRDLTIEQAGRVAGKIVYQRSNESDSDNADFFIRGLKTFKADSGALVLVDGLKSDLSQVDPADVESFALLKDTSATALYGVRGANEVILITTKQANLPASARIRDTVKNASESVTGKIMANTEKRSILTDKGLLKVRGKVVDELGEALPGVSIVSADQKTGTVTNIDGEFALTVPDSTTILASFIGYELRQMKADTSMLIALHESETQLDEVVVVAFGTQRKKSVIGSTEKVSSKKEKEEQAVIPEPVIGKRAWKKYLEKELIRPTDEVCANIKGKVVVRFYVNESGRPYNLQVIESLCHTSDQEAVRLINNGSNWTVGNAYVDVEVIF